MCDNFFIEIIYSSDQFVSDESIANADNLSFIIVALKQVLIRFKVEKHLSASVLVIGVVINIFNNIIVFGNDDCKLVSINV